LPDSENIQTLKNRACHTVLFPVFSFSCDEGQFYDSLESMREEINIINGDAIEVRKFFPETGASFTFLNKTFY
tara:strand:+ start:409 stop:627 length:219 start_codon:yes stop_codon:yes gene_type:complete